MVDLSQEQNLAELEVRLESLTKGLESRVFVDPSLNRELKEILEIQIMIDQILNQNQITFAETF